MIRWFEFFESKIFTEGPPIFLPPFQQQLCRELLGLLGYFQLYFLEFLKTTGLFSSSGVSIGVKIAFLFCCFMLENRKLSLILQICRVFPHSKDPLLSLSVVSLLRGFLKKLCLTWVITFTLQFLQGQNAISILMQYLVCFVGRISTINMRHSFICKTIDASLHSSNCNLQIDNSMNRSFSPNFYFLYLCFSAKASSYSANFIVHFFFEPTHGKKN